MEKVLCSVCGKEVIPEEFSSGYGEDKNGNKICYSCCAELDKKELRENGKLRGYFYNNEFTNWPGSFKIPITYYKKSVNNFGAIRTDFWLTWEGNHYYGRHVGNYSNLATIRKIKRKSRNC